MPKTHEMKSSKFLKKEDVGIGALCTVVGVEQQNVAKEGAEPDLKWCLIVAEFDKPLVLNATNIATIEAITKCDDTDGWKGKQIVLYEDPTIQWAGKIVGGIRIRAPKSQAAQDLPF
jgi:hypothetical protein